MNENETFGIAFCVYQKRNHSNQNRFIFITTYKLENQNLGENSTFYGLELVVRKWVM